VDRRGRALTVRPLRPEWLRVEGRRSDGARFVAAYVLRPTGLPVLDRMWLVVARGVKRATQPASAS
jgi:hypothetical protein